ncbi:AmmeMemoRadiSam system protein A [Candidatus Woesearchaeota archaeon]|nr:AmmeMemoRadiSam system protein A [Candidatus Woesearchaeota archaeon]
MELNDKEKRYLLELARKSIIESKLDNLSPPSDALEEKRGVFVTLDIDGELRGCIGFIEPIMAIYEAVNDCAYSAAYRDPRFPPVDEDEIKKLHIEISILTKPEPLEYKEVNNLLGKLKGDEGVILKKGPIHATFLPQVWEQLPDKEEFLSHLCLKASLDADEWKKGNLNFETYHVVKFEE